MLAEWRRIDAQLKQDLEPGHDFKDVFNGGFKVKGVRLSQWLERFVVQASCERGLVGVSDVLAVTVVSSFVKPEQISDTTMHFLKDAIEAAFSKSGVSIESIAVRRGGWSGTVPPHAPRRMRPSCPPRSC